MSFFVLGNDSNSFVRDRCLPDFDADAEEERVGFDDGGVL